MATSTTGRAADLMRHAFEALAKQDLDTAAEVWDDNTTDHFLALDLVVEGETALRAFFEETFTALSDFQFEIEAIHDVDETTAVGQWRITGTFDGGPFQGIKPTGKPVDIRGIDVMQFEGGILKHNTIYYDGLGFARQIGMLPTAGSGVDKAITSTFNAVTGVTGAIRNRLKR